MKYLEMIFNRVYRVFCLALIILFPIVLSLIIYSKQLIISNHEIKENLNNPIRIVHLTDLHNKEFEEGNSLLIEKVKEQSPDLIFMSGDMLNRDNQDIHVITELIRNLKGVAPIYYGYGNHEYQWIELWKKDLKEEIEEAGATVLDCSYVDVTIKGNNIRIGGYMGYYLQPHMMTKDPRKKENEMSFIEDFENTDYLKLLINHIPTQWVDWDYINSHEGVDIVFCGHYHGGIVQIPCIGKGLYAPYVGIFPKYTKGIFKGKNTTCILSAGLGSEYMVPRINNPPEIVAVNLVKEEE